jgi:transcription elongation factor Elf1
MNEAQELHCHNCDKYVQFTIDTELNGNHVLECPNCGHEHCIEHASNPKDTAAIKACTHYQEMGMPMEAFKVIQ